MQNRVLGFISNPIAIFLWFIIQHSKDELPRLEASLLWKQWSDPVCSVSEPITKHMDRSGRPGSTTLLCSVQAVSRPSGPARCAAICCSEVSWGHEAPPALQTLCFSFSIVWAHGGRSLTARFNLFSTSAQTLLNFSFVLLKQTGNKTS